MDVEAIAHFHLSQISMILGSTSSRQNTAWTESVNTALAAMEKGLYARLFSKSAALAVLRKAIAMRQSEPEPNNRWHIASLVESLATLRLLALRHPALRGTYRAARFNLTETLAIEC
ncbi:hypothetical protein ELI41_29695 (plasmid) [Rhizobium leguminosarum]|uniref:hypothetical protein n=1 Tax=Rhizobium leguminosarum TaxID=384 RepID=UPI0010314C8D|nr:hypothetical protein [Rhizobium leguminosarum]TAU80481.1 hypothetical protein ELI41_29695 [Rhizobium leguminosarum]